MKTLTAKQILYLLLAALGVLLPWYYNLQFMDETGGFELAGFIAAAGANAAARSLSADFMIVLAAFIAWMVPEARRLGMKHWWIYFVLMGLISAACAVPLFLFMRERKLEEKSDL